MTEVSPAAGPSCDPDWADAMLAIAALAIVPDRLKGIVVHGWPGPARDRLLGLLRAWSGDGPWAKLPLGTGHDRLVGGLDLAATLERGRAVAQTGVLAAADGGILVLAGAERIDRSVASTIAATIDTARVAMERDGFSASTDARVTIVALDESTPDEGGCPPVLSERLAFHVRLPQVPVAHLTGPVIGPEDIGLARTLFSDVLLPDDCLSALCEASIVLGVTSLRAPLLAAEAARAFAALDGRRVVDTDDVATAARLVLAPRATRVPATQEQPPPPETPEHQSEDRPADTEPDDGPLPDDILLAAILAALPPGLLEAAARRQALARGRGGSSGTAVRSKLRGRPAGVRPGLPHRGQRVDLVATLRTAAPWQSVRRGGALQPSVHARVLVRKDDLRIKSFEERSETVTIFAVDASGSAAMERLAEAKGAVELLLADCYVRRDRVSLLAFRKGGAETLLPPTRSLIRAKRALRDMAGGGGTPLAIGVDSALRLALSSRRLGLTPTVVFLTDGRANLDKDGRPGRAKAEQDALASARCLACERISAILIDTSARPQPYARTLAQAMNAPYVPLPYADARGVAQSVRLLTGDGLPGRRVQ